jgi:3-oxoacyl-[acyl-carrier-protein] synthase-3
MAINELKHCVINGIVNVIAPNDENNFDLPHLNAGEFKSKTGIETRKVDVSENNPIKTYFKQGVLELSRNLNWNLSETDVFICITQTPDTLFPSISSRLHGELEMNSSAICFDVNLGCSGYVFGLHIVMSLLSGFQKNGAKAILCTGDISTRLISKDDVSLRPLFSDAISVTAISYDKENSSKSYFNLESFGNGSAAITSVLENNHYAMKMNGLDVFNYSYQFVPKNIKKLLSKFNLELDNIDFVVFHQANKMINEAICRTLKLEEEKVLYSIEKYGNTAIASIPVTIVEHKEQLKSNDNQLLLTGFGVGFSVGTCLLNLPKNCFLYTISYDEN